MNIIDRILFQPPGGQFREYIGINTFFEPNDLSLYQKLIPRQFSMPQIPIVMIFTVDYQNFVGWRLGQYQEWGVRLRCVYNSVEGWYCITMPVTKKASMDGGRKIGFPKSIMDSLSLTQNDRGWVAEGMNKGQLRIRLNFSRGLTSQPSAWEKILLDDETFFKQGESFQLVPPSQGPTVYRIHLEHVVPPQWSPENGMVEIIVDPNEPWAGLIKEGNTYFGSFNHFKGGASLTWTVVK